MSLMKTFVAATFAIYASLGLAFQGNQDGYGDRTIGEIVTQDETTLLFRVATRNQGRNTEVLDQIEARRDQVPGLVSLAPGTWGTDDAMPQIVLNINAEFELRTLLEMLLEEGLTYQEEVDSMLQNGLRQAGAPLPQLFQGI